MCRKINNKFTLESALFAKKDGTLKSWVLNFLNSEGKNPKLASIFKESNGVWVDLIEYDLAKLVRVYGPEKEMIFKEKEEDWRRKVSNFVNLIRSGYKPFPLIATDYWNGIYIADGTHRFEALKIVGIKKYWTIFYIKNSNNIQIIQKNSLV